MRQPPNTKTDRFWYEDFEISAELGHWVDVGENFTFFLDSEYKTLLQQNEGKIPLYDPKYGGTYFVQPPRNKELRKEVFRIIEEMLTTGR